MKTYTVQRGDTLFKIAQQFYGDGDKFNLLAAYNGMDNPNALEVGQTLTIPSLSELENQLSGWHNYKNGTIFWRVTSVGIEIKGKGLIKNTKYTSQAKRSWENYQQPILSASKKHGVPVPVIIATISTESSGNSKAYRYEPAFYDRYIKEKMKANPYHDEPKRISASYGLMQIMYTTALRVGFSGAPEDLYDPATNIDAGAAYIKSQRNLHRWDPPQIACAYNAGSVRPTTKNAWGMFFHPGHLDRWIPSYNGAIEVITPANLPEMPSESVEPEPTPPVKPPKKPEKPSTGQEVTLKFLFPKRQGQVWKPMILDLFRHDESGISDPVTFTLDAPSVAPNIGYIYEIREMTKGVYDFVFTDAASSSIVYDIADYEADEAVETIDLRASFQPAGGTEMKNVTVRLLFPKEEGRVWRPIIVDMFKHEETGIGEPIAYTIKIPEHGPAGNYLYDIPNVAKGMYDVVFSDATTKSVIYDITDYRIENPLEIINLRRSRGIQFAQEPPVSGGLLSKLKAFLRAMLSKI